MRSFKNFISEKVEPARGIKPKAGDEAQFMDKHVVDVRDDPHNDKETKDGIKNSPAKKKRIADNDQASAEAAYEEMDPVNKPALKKKFKNRKDKDIDNDGDVDDSDEYLHNRRKAIKKAVSKEGTQKPYVSSDRDGKHVMNSSGKVDKTFSDMNSANAYLKKHYNRLMKEDTDDNPANRWHLCAKQVVHETWGEGVCIETQHADPDMEGNVDWYDVMFGHGVETKVSISELKVTKSEDHVHSSYKMKKKKMNEMSDAQMKKREEIVKSMKDKTADFKKRYGDQWKSVMYATATKQAMKEEVELDERFRYKIYTGKTYLGKEYGKDENEAKKNALSGGGAASNWKTKLSSNDLKAIKEEVEVDEVYEAAGKLSRKDEKALENYMKKFVATLSPEDKAKIAKDPKASADFFFSIFKQVASEPGTLRFASRGVTKKELNRLEDRNEHGMVALKLAQSYGTAAEVKKVQDINKRHNKKGSIEYKDQKERDAIIRKYFKMAEEVELDEAKMSTSQIAVLKKAYEPMRGKKISMDSANKLSSIMDKVGDDKQALIQLVKADIPFVSTSAVTRLISKHGMKGAEINKLKEEVELDEAKTDAYHKTMLKALGKSRLPRGHGYTSAVASNGDFVVYDGGKRIVGRLKKGEHSIKEEVDLDEARRGRPPKNANADGGMENIQMQLRKAISMNGQKEVEFNDGSKSKISQGMARAVLGKIDKMRQPKDKQNASRYIAKSLSNLKAFATGKEKGMDPEVEKQKILNLKSGYGSKMEETQVIDEAYKAGIVNLKDGSKIRIAPEDAKALNGLYKKLNASNKKQMEQRMMKDKKSFSEIIAFAKETVQ